MYMIILVLYLYYICMYMIILVLMHIHMCIICAYYIQVCMRILCVSNYIYKYISCMCIIYMYYLCILMFVYICVFIFRYVHIYLCVYLYLYIFVLIHSYILVLSVSFCGISDPKSLFYYPHQYSKTRFTFTISPRRINETKIKN